MNYSFRYVLPGLFLLVVGALLGVRLDSALSDDDTLEQLQKIEDAFMIINRSYVDEVESKELSESAIRSMLEELDPHSSFVDAEQVEELQDQYRGSFGGVGIWFEIINDTAQVISPIEGGPSEEVGIRGGDRIVAINDSSAIGIGSQGIQNRLRGPMGSEVDMTVERLGASDPLTFTVERDEIPLYSVSGSHMIDEETGYIWVTRFAQTTYDEFKEKLDELQEQGMQRLVLDMRSNPGGVMQPSVDIVDEFLGEGRSVVSTKGRSIEDQEFTTSTSGSFETQPLIVLVDQNSASASEIVAGALQDHDRALIVGRRTFGKGLVQNQFPLPDGSMLQMTTARYYTPSGRIIQSPYDSGNQDEYYEQKFESFEEATLNPDAYRDSIPDSLQFETEQGRTVYGGGGILPDFILEPDTTRPAVVQATLAGALQPLAYEYFEDHEQEIRETWSDEEESFMNDYTVDDQTLDAFWNPARSDEAREELGLQVTSDAELAEEEETIFTEAEIEEEKDIVALYVKYSIARQLFGTDASRPLFTQLDPEIQEALTLWNEAEGLAAHHHPDALEEGVGSAQN